VSPKVGGLIKKLYFQEGDRVKGPDLKTGFKGQILVELEDDNYRFDRDRAKAALDEAERQMQVLTQYRDREIEQAKFKLEEAEAQAIQLESDLRRSLRLRTGTNLAERDFEQAKSLYEAMERRVKQLRIDYELMQKGPRDINIQAAQARINQAKAELANREWQLDNCTVRAPISGTILSKTAEQGNIVNQLSLNLKGTICDMADLSDIEVDLTIQERDVAKVYKGQRCKVRSEAFPDRMLYDGEVSRLMPIADRAKGAVPVRVRVTVPKEEEGLYLKPDMGVIVSFFKGGEKKDSTPSVKK
jgi:multidrug resistance efflux pump